MSEQESTAEAQSHGTDEGLQDTVKLLIGRILSVLGILNGVGGTVAALAIHSEDVTFATLAILLGVVGYFLGARRLGAASVVVGVVLLLVMGGASSGLSDGR